MCPSIIYNEKYMLSMNLQLMGWVCKEVCHWIFTIKIPFWWLENFYPGRSWWILDCRFSCAVIVTYNDINDKIEVPECIFYHLQNYIILRTFWFSLKFLWALIFFWIFWPLILSTTLLAGLWIEYHTNNPLGDTANDDVITTRGVLSLSRKSLFPSHTICKSEF